MPRAEREQLILDIAGRRFARDGYHAAAMDEIARQAGVSKPMLYAYFESKEGLYLAYIERTGQELLERLQRTFSERQAELRLHARVNEFFCFVEEHRDGWRVLFTEASASRPVAEQVAELRGRIAGALRRMIERSVAGPPDAALGPAGGEVLAHAIVGAGESLANWWLDHPEVPRERMTGYYAQVIRGSLAALAATAGPPLTA